MEKIVSQKQCSKCRQRKPIGEFWKNKSASDGLQPQCKTCHKQGVDKWQSEHHDQVKKSKQKYKDAHRKPKRICKGKDKAKALIAWKSWYERNKKTIIENVRRWKSNNPDKVFEYNRTRRARKNGSGGCLTKKEWTAILERYGNKCLRCGRSDVKLTVDHVVPLSLGGSHTADNIQPLCVSCNSTKNNKHIDYRKPYSGELEKA